MPPNLEVEGRLTAHDELDVPALCGLGLEFTLRLADGRALDLRIVHEDGTIHSTARGLFTPNDASESILPPADRLVTA